MGAEETRAKSLILLARKLSPAPQHSASARLQRAITAIGTMSLLLRNTVDRLDRPSAYYLSKVQLGPPLWSAVKPDQPD